MKDTYLKSKKILIVDDEECLRSMLITILEDENFLNIITADCVKTALEICQQEKPDIAILDVMLPDGNGFELMETLRSFTNIPVIFLTAKDDIQDKYSGFGLGADDYITKPFMPKELIFRLNAVLRRCYKEDSPLIELRDCKIDLANAQVIWEDKILPLTAKEHDIYWIAIGLSLGIVIGLLIDDIGLGMCLGVMMGISVGPAIDVLRKNKKSEEHRNYDEKEYCVSQIYSVTSIIFVI